MKKNIFLSALLSIVFSALLCSDIIAQKYYVPDHAFRSELTSKGFTLLGANQDTIDAKDPLFKTYLDLEFSDNIRNYQGIQALNHPMKLLIHLHGSIDSIPSMLPDSISELKIMMGSSPNIVKTRFPAKWPEYLSDLLLDDLHYDINDTLSIYPSNLRTLTFVHQSAIISNLPNSLRQLLFADLTNTKVYLTDLPNNLTNLNITRCAVANLPAFPSSLKDLYLHDVNMSNAVPSLPAGLERFTYYGDYVSKVTQIPALPMSLRYLYIGERTDSLLSFPILPETLETLTLIANNVITCLPPIPQSVKKVTITINNKINCIPNHTKATLASSGVQNLSICKIGGGCPVGYNIRGLVFLDSSGDCARQAAEAKLKGIPIVLTKNGNNIYTTFTDKFGEYSFDTKDTGAFVVKADTSLIPFAINCSGPISNIDSLKDFDTIGTLALACPSQYDIGIRSIMPTSLLQPGQLVNFNLTAGDLYQVYGSKGCSDITGNVTLIISGFGKYNSPSPGGKTPSYVSPAGDTVKWNNIDFGKEDIYKTFLFKAFIDTTAKDSDMVCFETTVTPTTADADVTNNHQYMCYGVRNSFDPNDKSVSPIDTFTKNDEWLTYTIRFQNTGNAPAIDIKIKDTLDKNLDHSSMDILGYSHDVKPIVNSNGTVVFNFPKIMLPDSNSNEPQSHGWIQYRIKPKSNLALGTTINNTAYIYFDYNDAVVTNTSTTTLGLKHRNTSNVGNIGISAYPKNLNSNIKIYPNPTSHILYIENVTANNSIELYDITGRLMLHQISRTERDIINLDQLADGIYIVKIGVSTFKIIKN